MALVLNLDFLSEDARNDILEKYPNFIEEPLTGKERSEKTEDRIREILGVEKPKTTEYDIPYFGKRFELKQAEAYLKQPKFQQIKPNCYPYIICLLNHKDKSEWFLLKTSDISKKAGRENVEEGKLPLNSQHRYNITEGQIRPNKAFKQKAYDLGTYPPLLYYKKDLNLSSDNLIEIFNKIKKNIK